jgi:signal transduction histidine kinase
MHRRSRWLVVAAAVLLVGAVEALSDTAFDAFLPFPFHTLLLVAVVAAVAGAGSWLAFRQIDRLTRDLRERNEVLEGRNAVLRAVYDISLAVSGQADPDQTIASILDHARSLLGADGALLALDGPSGSLRLRAARAVSGVLIDGDPAGVGVGVMAEAEDDLGCYLRPGYEIRLSTPVGHGDGRIGMLGVAYVKSLHRRTGSADLETLSALATQAGLALEAARLQTELRALAIQGERERIAREMHDGLAQVLGYVNTKSQAVEELLAADRVPEARRQLAELAAAARSVYVDVREAILSLSTPVPDRGVAAALEEYSAAYAESSKLAVRFAASPAATRATLSAAAQAEVFSIAREALTNVRKHARAQRVTVELAVQGEELILCITDDGVGFDADVLAVGPERWPHFGLAGMRERAESVGGRISWHSRLGTGTEVELHVPVGGGVWAPPQAGGISPGELGRLAMQHQAVQSLAQPVSEAD